MHSFTQLFVAATVFTGVFAQYNDGYETVNLPTDPVQIRLAYQGPSAMMVSWNTFEQLPNPTVTYGTDPNALTLSASSSVSITYPTSLTYNNHVNITGLSPFTTYYYLPQYSNATTPYTFTTARAAGDMTPFTVGVVVDMGTFGPLGLSTTVGAGAANPLRPGEQTTITALTEMIDSYEFLVHAGDISYADAWLKEEIGNYLATTTTSQGAVVYESILNAFYDELEQVTSSKPYMVNPGNHEANCDNGGTTNKTSGVKYTESICMVGQTNFTGYINHFRMPSGPSGGLGNMWFSYDYGMVHFVHIDTETDLGNGVVGPDEGSTEFGGPFGTYNQQIDWFTNDLATVNRTLTPWVVVFGHRGWYLSSTTNPTVQAAFENLFYQYGVDVYVNGHAHLYERTVPIYNNIIDPNGLNNPKATLYLTNGAAGHYDGLDTFGSIEPYSAYHTVADYSWATLTFTNSTYMTLNGLWSANNTIFDTAVLYKEHNTVVGTSTSSSASFSTTSSTVQSSSVPPTTTTNSPTTTTSTVIGPTYTNFSGLGHLLVYLLGVHQGDIGSAGTWYNQVSQSVATYTAVPLNASGSSFTLQHSSSYCTIGSDASFGCAAAAAGATVFGQTPDGNLTYQGSDLFYASQLPGGSTPVGATKPTIYATALAYTLNIVWSTEGAVVSSTSTSSSSVLATSSSVSLTISSSSSFATSSSSSPTPSSTSSSVSQTSSSSFSQVTSSSSPVTSSSSVFQTSSSSSFQVISSSSVPQSSLSSSSQVAASIITVTMTQPGSLTTIISTLDLSFTSTLTTSIPYTTTATDDLSFTNTLTTSVPYIITAVSTEIDDFLFTDTLTTSVPYTTTAVSTQTDDFSTNILTTSIPYTTTAVSTETDDLSFSFTQTTTETDDLSFTTSIPYTTTAISVSISTDDISFTTSIPYTTTAISTLTDDISFTTSIPYTTAAISGQTEVDSYTKTTTQDIPTTIVSVSIQIETDSVFFTKTTTLPASTIISTRPASTYTYTQSGSIRTVILPASIFTTTKSASDSILTVTKSGNVVTSTRPASTFTLTEPASTVTKSASIKTVTQQPSTYTLSEPVITITKSASTFIKTVTQQASTYTLTEPVVTVTKPASTSIRTVTQQASTHTLTEPVVTITKPASTLTKSGTIVTVTKIGTVTSVRPASTVTLLETKSVTSTEKVVTVTSGSRTVTKTVTATV